VCPQVAAKLNTPGTLIKVFVVVVVVVVVASRRGHHFESFEPDMA